jgi:Protein of unknown function (DUF3761)
LRWAADQEQAKQGKRRLFRVEQGRAYHLDRAGKIAVVRRGKAGWKKIACIWRLIFACYSPPLAAWAASCRIAGSHDSTGDFMRIAMVALTVAGLLAAAAHADTMKNCSAAWGAMAPADKAKTTYPAYSKMCLAKTYTVAAQPPAGATAQCKDNTYVTTKTHAGACSGHGGVAKWL